MRIRVQAGVSRGTGGGSSRETSPDVSPHDFLSPFHFKYTFSYNLLGSFLQLEGTRKEILRLCPFAMILPDFHFDSFS